jgi:hypothetical protein
MDSLSVEVPLGLEEGVVMTRSRTLPAFNMRYAPVIITIGGMIEGTEMGVRVPGVV